MHRRRATAMAMRRSPSALDRARHFAPILWMTIPAIRRARRVIPAARDYVPRPRSCRPTASTATSIWCLKTSARAPVAPGARPTRLTPTSRRSCKISGPASTPIRSELYPSIPSRGGRGMRLPSRRRTGPARSRHRAEISSALQDFIAANATKRFDMQLALPFDFGHVMMPLLTSFDGSTLRMPIRH